MEIKITKDTLSPATRRLARALDGSQARHFMEALGLEFRNMTVESFQSIADRPAPWPAKKDGSPSNLVQSTTLRQSFQVQVGVRAVTISSSTAYAAAHQFGSPSRNLPPRPFMPFLSGQLTAAAKRRLEALAKDTLESLATG